jgi:hypothetical protein
MHMAEKPKAEFLPEKIYIPVEKGIKSKEYSGFNSKGFGLRPVSKTELD